MRPWHRTDRRAPATVRVLAGSTRCVACHHIRRSGRAVHSFGSARGRLEPLPTPTRAPVRGQIVWGSADALSGLAWGITVIDPRRPGMARSWWFARLLCLSGTDDFDRDAAVLLARLPDVVARLRAADSGAHWYFQRLGGKAGAGFGLSFYATA